MDSNMCQIFLASSSPDFVQNFGVLEPEILTNILGIRNSKFLQIVLDSECNGFKKYFRCLSFKILFKIWASETTDFYKYFGPGSPRVLTKFSGVWESRFCQIIRDPSLEIFPIFWMSEFHGFIDYFLCLKIEFLANILGFLKLDFLTKPWSSNSQIETQILTNMIVWISRSYHNFGHLSPMVLSNL